MVGEVKHRRKDLENILDYLSSKLREILGTIPEYISCSLEEIRIRLDKPLMVIAGEKDYILTERGLPTLDISKAYIVTKDDVLKTFQLISDYSIYAVEEELRNGFLTLRGGYRVGIAGKVVLENGAIKTLKHVSGFNIRINREIKGISKRILPYITEPLETVYNTLIISPPQCGKTTLLRDIALNISNGIEGYLRGKKVSIIDERSEIAGCYMGVPQNDVGIRTDVIDACPKAQGILMVIRAMSPEVIVTDEIGRREDVVAINEAVNSGVKVITTVHGKNLEEVSKKPHVSELVANGIFERYVILSKRLGSGTIEAIIEGQKYSAILSGPIK